MSKSDWLPIEDMPQNQSGWVTIGLSTGEVKAWRDHEGNISMKLSDHAKEILGWRQGWKEAKSKKLKKSKWISLEEQLPPHGYCLVTIKGMDNMLYAFYDEPNMRFTMEAMRHVNGITHWRKLPKTLAEEKEANE